VPDVHNKATRSRNMAAIKGKDTKPELLIRSLLHRRGFRYRLHDQTLPGKPDLVFPKYNAIIFIHGCFWHGHHCHLFKMPSTRTGFWARKILKNQENDKRQSVALKEKGLRIMNIWECALKGKVRCNPDELETRITKWLLSDRKSATIQGR